MLLAKFDLRELARRGAEARLAELQAEIADIVRAFPGLRTQRQGGRTGNGVTRTTAPRRRRRRTPMTAAQRRAVSARMKKYWAERRKEKSAR